MIYTITLNPSLDYIMHMSHFEIGETNRSLYEDIYPGGKGFNVSTILHRLGLETTALGFVAGFTGEEIKKQLIKRGFECKLCELDHGISRINVKMKGEQETEINGSGPDITKDKLDEMFHQLDALTSDDLLVLAGSIPLSLPDDIYEQIMKRLTNKNIKIVVDATNKLLTRVLPYHPFLIKPNKRELEELFGIEIHDQTTLITYAKKLQNQGACNVLVSLGKDGALLISEDQHIYKCGAPLGTLINSVGSGDSMVAGFIAGYLKHHSYKEALRLGSACGSATAFSNDLASLDKIKEMYQQIESEEIL